MKKAGPKKGGKRLASLRLFSESLFHLNFRRVEECRTLLRWLDPQAGEDILDVGCGDGYFVRRIAKSGARVVGIDIIDGRATRRGRGAPQDGSELLTMNAEDMEFEPASFDKVISLCVLEHIRRDDLVFEKIAAVLRPGGLLALSADSLSNPGITGEEIVRHRRLYHVRDYYTLPKIKRKLDAAGLELEAARYVLTTPLALSLARLSWKCDSLSRAFFVVRWLGYLGIWAAAGFFVLRRNGLTGPSDRGLTLLVRARKSARFSDSRGQLPI
jgi:2-polyprenyl-3-methyl-5-hydroxy-6-metoxy-1,4-benzoquinol methylase